VQPQIHIDISESPAKVPGGAAGQQLAIEADDKNGELSNHASISIQNGRRSGLARQDVSPRSKN